MDQLTILIGIECVTLAVHVVGSCFAIVTSVYIIYQNHLSKRK